MNLSDRVKLVIHGGAGAFIRANLDEVEVARTALAESLESGFRALLAKKSAIDAVEAAIRVMEDCPSFNAGKGAVYTAAGTHELDASIMDGSTLRAGAVAGVSTVRNPIRLARAIMDHSPHVFLIGDGAESFARDRGMTPVQPTYFDTERSWDELQAALRAASTTDGKPTGHYGTVGAVALDASGRLAAATSTGGMTNKQCGRVGDTPVIGAGTYANAVCAVSCTGWGEFYVRAAAAHSICTRVELMRQSIEEAADLVINHEITNLGGRGGAIVLGSDGKFAMPFNTPGMFRGYIGGRGVKSPVVSVWNN